MIVLIREVEFTKWFSDGRNQTENVTCEVTNFVADFVARVVIELSGSLPESFGQAGRRLRARFAKDSVR